MDEQRLDEGTKQRILEFLPLAEAIGRKYAFRQKRHSDEAVAEAWFQTVMFFQSNTFKLFGLDVTNERSMVLFRRFIYRRLIDYFKGVHAFRRTIKAVSFDNMIIKNYSVQCHVDEEMLTWLSGIVGDDEVAIAVLGYLRNGLTFDEMEYLEEKVKYTSRDIFKHIAKRLKNLHQMKCAGVVIKRSLNPEIEDADIPSVSELPA